MHDSEASKTLLSHLLPVENVPCGFTTCTGFSLPVVVRTELDDKSLGVHKVWSRTNHPIVSPPTPKSRNPIHDAQLPTPKFAWEAFYPKGSINPSGDIPGGFGFYLSGPKVFQEKLRGASEVTFSYRMMLQEEWEWVKGGKLPGVFGGEGDLSYGCSGGRQENRCKCFDFRPMWRPKCVGELYTYVPPTEKNNTILRAVPPKSIENSDYGFSAGRGAYLFEGAVGCWISVAFRVKLNEPGSSNGEVQLWIDGDSVIHIEGLSLRDSDESWIKGMHFQTFFGGHGQEWASPKDQRAWFADVTGAIIG